MSGWWAVQATRAEARANENAEVANRAEQAAEEKRQEADESAKEANVARWETTIERVKSDIKAMSLQVDLDLADFKTDPRSALLRLARPMKDPGDAFPAKLDTEDEEGSKEVVYAIAQANNRSRPEFVALREFVTASVLARGQDYAPLLPPILQDGQPAREAHLLPGARHLLTHGGDSIPRL